MKKITKIIDDIITNKIAWYFIVLPSALVFLGITAYGLITILSRVFSSSLITVFIVAFWLIVSCRKFR